jgi:hypothetical protein
VPLLLSCLLELLHNSCCIVAYFTVVAWQGVYMPQYFVYSESTVRCWDNTLKNPHSLPSKFLLPAHSGSCITYVDKRCNAKCLYSLAVCRD